MKHYGYIIQEHDNGREALDKRQLTRHGCTQIITDQASIVLEKRPGWQRLLRDVAPGERVCVVRFATLSYAWRVCLDALYALMDRQIQFEALEDGFATARMQSVSATLGALKDCEKRLRRQQLSDARQGKQARSQVGGRPEKVTERQQQEIKRMYMENIPVQAICQRWNISRPTLYKYLKR